MKKIVLFSFALISFVLQVHAQDDAIQRFFSKYMDDDRFSRVYISPKMMQMAGGFLKSAASENEQETKELGTLISKVRGVRILSSDEVDGKEFYQEAMSTLSKNKYEELMDVQDKGSSLKFMVREEGGLVKELLMITGDQKDFTLLSMLGSFTYAELNILAENTDIPGMEEYGKGSKGNK
ncbi:DUF4252 domain-containing protein [Algoriphagus namhaensis]